MHGIIIIAIGGLLGAAETPNWQSEARLHRTLRKAIRGTLTMDAEGIEFRSDRFSQRWPFFEIHTFDLSMARELILTSYQNRRWHQPGERRFHFSLREAIPPGVASQLAQRIGKPVRNGVPEPKAPAIAEIPARHRTRFGGSNGMLRFRDAGIDYVTRDGRDGRSWRWSDLQTIANPNAYQLRVTAWREIADFELKQPLARELFDRLWDRLYAADLNVAPGVGGGRQ